jgi:ABC-2 type transport system permease protein
MGSAIQNILAIAGAVITVAFVLGSVIAIPKLKIFWPAFKKYWHLLVALVSRDIKVKYRRSVLGLLWSVLNPLFMMLILTAVFSNVFRVQIENYPAFYITGILVFQFVNEATSSSLLSVLNAASLIKKVYIPKYIFPLEKCIFAFTNMIFTLIALIIVYSILGMPASPTMLLLPVPLILVAIFAFGLSLILASTNVFFRDITHIWGIWSTAWMYLTPILYPLTLLPEIMQTILSFNPLVYYVNYARDVMMYNTVPSLQVHFICIGFALLFLVIGLFTFRKAQDRFILHI